MEKEKSVKKKKDKNKRFGLSLYSLPRIVLVKKVGIRGKKVVAARAPPAPPTVCTDPVDAERIEGDGSAIGCL